MRNEQDIANMSIHQHINFWSDPMMALSVPMHTNVSSSKSFS